MTPERWKKIDDLFEKAMELPAEGRAAFLDSACGSDVELRREVESLLSALDESGTFIDRSPVGEAGDGVPRAGGELAGVSLGSYRLVSLLGSGGMGDVYLAEDTVLDRRVAVKILPQHLAANPEALARFEREAKAVAALSHPNILAIHNFGSEGGRTYAVMELLVGETLRARIQRAPLPWREAVKIGSAVADGLSAAHSKGIIHRDIKPENIFLTGDGGVKILDFGIARVKRAVSNQAETLITEHGRGTLPGTLMGTIGYMSPEQVRGESADAPSDIFSLGCVIHEMIAGTRPFQGKTAAEAMAAILRDRPAPLPDGLGDLPAHLSTIVERCLEKSPEDRFQSARDLALDLRSLLTIGSESAASIGAARVIQPARPRTRLLALAAVAASVALLGGLLGYRWWNGYRAPQNSIAVLPFSNESGEASLEYLGEGLAESLVESLSLLPQLRVMGWSTVRFKAAEMKSADPASIGRELKVRSVITGRVARNGESFAVAVEMIDAGDGTRVWGERYSLNPSDRSNLQPAIAARISDSLSIRLSGDQQKQLEARYSTDTDAYRLYLQGKYLLNQRAGIGKQESLDKATAFFKQALEKDPAFALAYAGLADAHALMDDDFLANSARARGYAYQAISLDKSLAEPHATLAFIANIRDWKWAEAEAGYRKSIALNPNYATAHHWYAEFLACEGRFDEAIAEIRNAQRIEPLSNPINTDWGVYLFFARRYQEAIAQLNRTIELFPDATTAMRWISNCHEQLSNYDAMIGEYLEAIEKDKAPREVIDSLREAYQSGGVDSYRRKRLQGLYDNLKKGRPASPASFAYLHASLGEVDQAVDWLEKGYQQKHFAMVYIKVEPRYDRLKSSPRFIELVRRIGL